MSIEIDLPLYCKILGMFKYEVLFYEEKFVPYFSSRSYSFINVPYSFQFEVFFGVFSGNKPLGEP